MFDFWLAHLIKPGLSKRVNRSETILRVQSEHALKALDGFRSHLAHISALKRLWLGLGGELQADEARVLVEKLLLVWCQLAKDLLNAEKLVNF